MTVPPDWLPHLVCLQDYGGEWDPYFEAIYKFFTDDFVKSKPKLGKRDVKLKHGPPEGGKEATFWHITHEGKIENQRTPDLRRCERIRWPRPIIKHADEPVIKVWENKRKTETRICIWFEDVEYLVVLASRKGYVLLWTAYPVTWAHTKRKLQKEYEAFLKANAAP